VSDAYRDAGVDTGAAAKAVALIADLAANAGRAEVAGGIGGFAGLYRIGDGRLLAAAADGVGTKLEIARRTRRLDTVGIDLVAMCADDVVCTGAEPLVFLDYLAVGTVVPDDVASIVAGVAEGCRRAGCALVGGETAEHPGLMDADAFDLAGFCVGIVEQDSLLGPERVREGDLLVGLASSGLHANGYSLVRSSLLPAHGLDEAPTGIGRPLADELLEPCAIYAPAVLGLARDGLVRAAAHITGGGIVGNVARGLPDGLGATIERGAWPEHAIFGLVQQVSGAEDEDMFATFNMGIGMVLIVAPDVVDEVLHRVGHDGYRVGMATAGAGVRIV
jgi:phosphoribosylformylglycinamidine cyclo-ligase